MVEPISRISKNINGAEIVDDITYFGSRSRVERSCWKLNVQQIQVRSRSKYHFDRIAPHTIIRFYALLHMAPPISRYMNEMATRNTLGYLIFCCYRVGFTWSQIRISVRQYSAISIWIQQFLFISKIEIVEPVASYKWCPDRTIVEIERKFSRYSIRFAHILDGKAHGNGLSRKCGCRY